MTTRVNIININCIIMHGTMLFDCFYIFFVYVGSKQRALFHMTSGCQITSSLLSTDYCLRGEGKGAQWRNRYLLSCFLVFLVIAFTFSGNETSWRLRSCSVFLCCIFLHLDVTSILSYHVGNQGCVYV